jgi:hypothetical protein
MRLILTKIILTLIAVITLPSVIQSQISTEGQEPLTEKHLRLVLGDSTSLTDLSLPDGEVMAERWYRGTDHESYYGFFHVKLVVSPENNDELIAQHDWIFRYRGKIGQGRLHTTCKRDEYYTLQSFKLIGKHGAGKGRDYVNFAATFEPSESGDSLPYVIKAGKYFSNQPKGCPENTMMLFLLAEKVRELPFNQDEVFTFNHFFPFEMELGRNATVRYVGPEDVMLDERHVLLHKFVCDGQGLKTIYLLVDDNHELIKITDGKNIGIILTTKQEVIDSWDF